MDSFKTTFISLDFDGGQHIYRNDDIPGANLPALVAPSGISSGRRERLAHRLNRECADKGVCFTAGCANAASTIHIGRTNAFDAFGRFLGLAEGIGHGDAFVLLDDTASDAELLSVIRHEAGHLLGTLDHGGEGLARYAWEHVYDETVTYIYSPFVERQSYLQRQTTTTVHYQYVTAPSDVDDITVSYHEDGTEVDHHYSVYGRYWNNESNSYEWEEHTTQYIEETRTIEAYKEASGIHAKNISVSGGNVSGCIVDEDMSVSGSNDYSRFHMEYVHWQGAEGNYSGLMVPDRTTIRESDYKHHQGIAIDCKIAGELSVFGNGVAQQCEAVNISVSGGREQSGYDFDSDHRKEDEHEYAFFRGQVKNCTVNGGLLAVDFGGDATDVLVKGSGNAVVGISLSINATAVGDTPYFSDEEKAEFAEQVAIHGYGFADNLTVESGKVEVNYGGELHNAKIGGFLQASEGAKLSGIITCKGVAIADVVPLANITVKLNLHDYAIANETDKKLDSDGNGTITYYYANYTTRTEYYAEGRVVSVSGGTFDNKDGRFDMSDWEYVFSADIGAVDAMALPSIVVDFDGTEKDFDSGTLYFSYPTTSHTVEFNLMSSKKRWQALWASDKYPWENISDSDDYFMDTLIYNPTLQGEVADVLWIENGYEETEYTVPLPTNVMGGVMEEVTITNKETGNEALANATLKGAELVIKGGADTGTYTVAAEDPNKQEHECELELIVVPESIPVVGKLGAKKYSTMLRKAQKARLTKITDILPYDIETTLFGMKFCLSNMGVTLTVNWTKPSMELRFHGKMDWEIGKGENKNLTIDLSDDNYISVTHKDGVFGWDIVGELSVPDFKIGKFGFSNMSLTVNKGESTFGASGYVQLPGISYKFGGSIGIVNGYLDSMSIGVDNLNVPLGATGLMLQSISGSVEDIATSLDMTFGGSLGLTYGPKVSVTWNCDWLGIDDGEYSLLEIDLGAKISTSGEITGQAGIASLGGFIVGAGGVVASEGSFSVNGNFSLLNGCITIKGELLSGADGVVISGKGTMSVPRSRFFGPLAGLGLSVNAMADFGDRYVLAWEDMEIFGNKFSVGVKCTFDGDVAVLNSNDLLDGDGLGTRGVHSLESAPLRGEHENLYSTTTPSASQKYIVSNYGTSLFQMNFSVAGTYMSLLYDGTEYSQEAISAGLYDNMQIVNELTSEDCITVAVNNADLGEWQINAYGDDKATFGAYRFTESMANPTVNAVELGADQRSATIRYTVNDIAGVENATVSIFRVFGNATEHNGALVAKLAAADATGSFNYAPAADLPGGSYAFYLMVSGDNYAPAYSDLSAAVDFIALDTEAPDQIQRVSAEWHSTGSVLSWSAPYDDNSVAGYKISYRASEEVEWSEADATTTSFTFSKVPNGFYTYRVAAYDSAGNVAAWSVESSILVNTSSNAAHKNAVFTEDLTLAEFESAVNVDTTGATLTAAENSLVSHSTLGNAKIGGIIEDTVVSGEAEFLPGAKGYGLTVNGGLSVGVNSGIPVSYDPFAEASKERDHNAIAVVSGVSVTSDGVLTVGSFGKVDGATVASGGAVVLAGDAEITGLVMDYGTTLTLAGSDHYILADDIRTAGTLNTYRRISGYGQKIVFEQYKQVAEYETIGLAIDNIQDNVAFTDDMDKLGSNVLEIEIDSNVYGIFKIAGKAAYFDGTVTVTDHADGSSAVVGIDSFMLVGNALCRLQKFSDGLYLSTTRSTIGAPTVTVEYAEDNAYDMISLNATAAEDTGYGKAFTFRYSLNADMSDAVVVTASNIDGDGNGILSLDKYVLADNATYYVQAAVENSYGVKSQWSDTVSFTVVPKLLPAAPATLTVTGATSSDSDTITFTADGVEADSTTIRNYRFRYADNPEFENAITITTGQRLVNYASISKSGAGITDGMDYYVQAGVQIGHDWSYWSDTVVFNTRNWDYDGLIVDANNSLTLEDKSARNITVTDRGYFYGGTGRVNGLTIENGGFFRDDGATVTHAVVNGGEYWLYSGSVTDLVVNSGELRIMDGTLNGATIGVDAKADLGSSYQPTITGTILIQGGMSVNYNHPGVTTDADFIFDLGAHEATKDKMFINYTSPLTGMRTFTVKLDDTPETGDYRFAYTPNSGELNLTLVGADGANPGMVGTGLDPIQYNGLYYSLVDQEGIIYLHVSATDAPAFIGKVKLSRNGTVYDSADSYSDLVVSSSSECDYVLVDKDGQLFSVTVGKDGRIETNGLIFGATIENGGSLTLKADGCALSDIITIKQGGNVTIAGGKVDLGAAFHLAGGKITVKGRLQSAEEEGQWGPTNHWFVFDLDQVAAAPDCVMVSNYELLQDCTPMFTVNVANRQADGLYKLLGNAANFNSYISITCDGNDDNSVYLSAGEETRINNKRYALAIQHNVLTLTVGKDVPYNGEPEEEHNIMQTQQWLASGNGSYVVEYSKDSFLTALHVNVAGNALDSYAMPEGDYQWRVRNQAGDDWIAAGDLDAEGGYGSKPLHIASNGDGVADMFFASVCGAWGSDYVARHIGLQGGWSGTDEAVALEGRNKLADIIEGSDDANLLLMTDDANGDALFADDIYSAFPSDVVARQSRLARIDEIRAGAGDDIVDLTSQDFAYVGDGMTVRGGLGDDVIWANMGNNMLFGDAGNDRIVGASGNDVIIGGAGDDSLHGGGGNDIFAFGGDWGQDTVEQLANGKVTLWFQDGSNAKWDASTLTYADGGNSVKVTGVGLESITLKFGNADAQYADLAAAGAFDAFTSEKIFEDRNRGMLA